MKKILFIAAAAAMMFASCDGDNNVIPGGNGGGEYTEPETLPAPTVVFNELCGNKVVELPSADGKLKYIELYNTTSAAVSLEGWTIRKYVPDAETVLGIYDVCWTAPAGTTLAAGAYLILASDQEDPALGFNAGLSAKKGVKFALIDAAGNMVDRFVRGENKTPFEEVEPLAENKDASFSRVPNGTGEWVYAAPTPNAANGAKTGDIEHE